VLSQEIVERLDTERLQRDRGAVYRVERGGARGATRRRATDRKQLIFDIAAKNRSLKKREENSAPDDRGA
jgi:hypothetical protein